MLFGMNRVPAWVHITATVLVALGTLLSAFWILALSSWMQTPAGHVMEGGVLIAGDWLQVIFNPSFPYVFTHMLLASGLTAAFVVSGLSAWRLLRAPADASALCALRTGVIVAVVLAPLQMFVGDQHGLNALEYQPAKVAAIEALWKTERGAPLVLFAVPNATTRHNDFAIEVPNFASLLLTHDPEGEVKGIEAFAPDTPPVAPLFFAFRIMVGIGVLMLALAGIGAWFLRRNEVPPRWLLWTLAGGTFSGWVATLSGWLVTEIGRQPWLVTGILRTAQAVGRVPAAHLGASFTGYVLVYILMLAAYVVVVTHLAGKGVGADSRSGARPAAAPTR
jgi:cytochrome d ubiquinol oxidase subunit I